MFPLEFLKLPIEPPSALSLASAELLRTEVYRETNYYPTPQKYLEARRPDVNTLYALIRVGSGLLAAATVILDSGITFINEIAVHPDQKVRGKGYGYLFMCHIAQEAKHAGADHLKLDPVSEESRIAFSRMGFQSDEIDNPYVAMTACVDIFPTPEA
jgi:hypothetical protein